jgi:hypothetical protein
MKWEDRRESRNVEDRRDRPDIAEALTEAVRLFTGEPVDADNPLRHELHQQLSAAQADSHPDIWVLLATH